MKFYLNPSNQPGNVYKLGDTNEKENMTKIAKLVGEALQRSGQEVKIGTGMESGVAESNAWPADVHVPLHSNASAVGVARGARVFYGNAAGAAKIVWEHLDAIIGGMHVPPSRETQLYEINRTNAQCIYVEAAFHDNPTDCDLLINHRGEIAEAIAQGLCKAYGLKYVEPAPAQEKPPEWAEEAVAWAHETGIMKDGRYNEPVTRAEAATMIYRLFNLLKG